MTTNLDMQDPQPAATHNHAPDENSVAATKCLTSMKQQAKSTQDKPSVIYAQGVTEATAETRSVLPSEDIIKRTLRNQRIKLLPQEPATLRDLRLEGEWTTTSGPDPQPFLIYDNGPDANARIIAFGTDRALRLLSTANTWMMDGNFSMAPSGFLQLYIIRVPFGEITLSTVYALLQDKSQDTYEELLSAVIDRCHELELLPDPATIIVDFEQAAIPAISVVLGPDTTTQGCFYHLTQSTWRKIQDLGLTNT